MQEFTQSDKLMAHEIQRKTLRLQKLQDAVNNWKLKIAANVRRSTAAVADATTTVALTNRARAASARSLRPRGFQRCRVFGIVHGYLTKRWRWFRWGSRCFCWMLKGARVRGEEQATQGRARVDRSALPVAQGIIHHESTHSTCLALVHQCTHKALLFYQPPVLAAVSSAVAPVSTSTPKRTSSVCEKHE